MSKPLSLRARLTGGYALIAVVATMVFAAILAVALPPFYIQLERQYAHNAAASVAAMLEKAGGVGPGNNGAVATLVDQTAAANDVHVRVLGTQGEVLAESRTPTDGSRSGVVGSEPFLNRDGQTTAHIEISRGPKAGTSLTSRIVWSWLLAGVLAVAISAGFGWLLAGRVGQPIYALTRASAEMAEGNLAARAPVDGDAEIRALAGSFNEMAENVEEMFDSLTRFIGDAAHEIGTPLTALRADLELAREAPDADDVPKLLDQSIAHTDRISAISRDLLTLSRLESVGSRVHEPLDLRDVTELVVDGFASRAEQADIDLALEVPQRRIEILGDQGELSRALGNLLDNALKFSSAGSAIQVSVGVRQSEAFVVVADHGRGISPQELPLVFDRFHRAKETSTVPGSGLGLAIVKATALAHGGDVEAQSDNSGTRFTFTLPLASSV